MTNEELKKKILTIVRGAMLEADELPFIETTDNIADALIAAGIGDVKSLRKVERALRNAATRLKCRGGLGKGFCRVDKCDYYHCNNDNGCIKAHLEQAEKELAEEGKDERP